MARTSSIYDHFGLYLTPVTLTFNLPEKIFKWHFSYSRGTTVQNFYKESKSKKKIFWLGGGCWGS